VSLSADVQQLEPGQIVSLYIVDATEIGAELYRFHSYGQLGDILFQGETYNPWPMDVSGFELSGTNQPAPRMKMGNVGGFLTALCLGFDDLVGAVVTRKRTLGKYLDGQPEADPDEEFPPEVWFIEQKVAETSEYVDFELSSSLTFDGVQIPRRQIIANYCPWRYRGGECGYMGAPVATQFDQPTDNPELDICGKRLQSCRLRFGEDSELPFGGFPASGLVR